MAEANLIQKVKDARRRLDEARREEQRLQGRCDALRDRLKSEFGFSTLEEADAHAEELAAKAAKLQRELTAKVDEIDDFLEAMNAPAHP